MITQPNFKAAKEYVFTILKTGLNPKLHYHGINHTKKSVLPAAEKLAGMEGVTGDDLDILKAAALYHDTGFLRQYKENEPRGVEIASETLPLFGYTPDQIERIKPIIMATQLKNMKQVPDQNDLLQKLMCDADLYYLGGEHFPKIGERLRKELWENGMQFESDKWDEIQVGFLNTHNYFTDSAIRTRGEGKKNNLEDLEKRIKARESFTSTVI